MRIFDDAAAGIASKIVKGATLITYPGAPHEPTATHKHRFNADVLEFLQRATRQPAYPASAWRSVRCWMLPPRR